MEAAYYDTKMERTLLEAGANVDIQDIGGWTALIAASNKGHTEIMLLLLSEGAIK